jgi:endonuclease YncB( thermonuclease family)
VKRSLSVACALIVASLVAVTTGHDSAAGARTSSVAEGAVVGRVVDGDTLSLRDGRSVRLLQIDTPELGTGECYSRAAANALRVLAPVGTVIQLEGDTRLDDVDRFGRILRYVTRQGRNVNVELVRQGAAAPYFYRGERGRHASGLMNAARQAQQRRRGLWGACPRSVLDPNSAVDTGRRGTTSGRQVPPLPVARSSGTCDPNYAGGCVPPAPPDLDCADIRALGIAPVRIVGADPHRLDGDGDGFGCE